MRDVADWLAELKGLPCFSSKGRAALEEASELFANGARLGSDGHGAFRSSSTAAAWCQDLKKRLEKLSAGQFLLAPGGWVHNKGGHAIIYLFHRASEKEFRFAVCNTGEGVNDHPEASKMGSHEMKSMAFGMPLDVVLL